VRILDDLSTGRREYASPGSELVVGDVADTATVRAAMKGMDGCFHLAAIASVQRSVESWLASHRVNVGGTVNVLEAARAGGGVPVVYASSATVYGDNAALPLAESEPLAPLSPYGAEKAASELHARAAFAVHRVPSTGLRFFNVFGPRQHPASPHAGVIAIFAENLLEGRPLTIFGDGEQSRDFVFVADAVAALMTSMEKQTGSARIFNVGCGGRVTLKEIIGALERVIGGRAAVRHEPARNGDVRHLQSDGAQIRGELGFVPHTVLEEGLAILVRWLQSERRRPARVANARPSPDAEWRAQRA
jgi:UDP-glucose 4-epimerase